MSRWKTCVTNRNMNKYLLNGNPESRITLITNNSLRETSASEFAYFQSAGRWGGATSSVTLFLSGILRMKSSSLSVRSNWILMLWQTATFLSIDPESRSIGIPSSLMLFHFNSFLICSRTTLIQSIPDSDYSFSRFSFCGSLKAEFFIDVDVCFFLS